MQTICQNNSEAGIFYLHDEINLQTNLEYYWTLVQLKLYSKQDYILWMGHRFLKFGLLWLQLRWK